jgi:hypothetical protein
MNISNMRISSLILKETINNVAWDSAYYEYKLPPVQSLGHQFIETTSVVLHTIIELSSQMKEWIAIPKFTSLLSKADNDRHYFSTTVPV